MRVMVADRLDDIAQLKPLLEQAVVAVQSGGLPMHVDKTMLNLAKMVSNSSCCVLILESDNDICGVLALAIDSGVANERCFYMTNFAHTRMLVDAAKLWAKHNKCIALKITSSSVEESKRSRVLNLMSKRGGFVKYSETYMVRL